LLLVANPWFRLYHEFATDPKVQMLSEALQRRFVMLLCLRCCNGDETLQDEEVAFQLRISVDEYASTKAVLMSKSLIDKDNKPIAWNERQFDSDSSTSRVRAYRDKKKQEGNVTETKCNAVDTEADTDSDTDTEGKDTAGSGEPPLSPPPKKKSGAITLKTYIENRKAAGLRTFDEGCAIYQYAESVGLPQEFLTIAWHMYREKYYGAKKKYDDWPKAFLNALKDGWLKAWYLDNGIFKLTTAGQQAQLARKSHVQH
jgi:hypothetical protein